MLGKITKRTVDATKPSERDVFVWDEDLSGFGLKVTPEGRKVYIVQYRMGGRGTPTKRLTIGKHGVFTPDEARERARDALKMARDGKDPSEVRKAALRASQAAVRDKVEDVVERYVEKALKRRGRRYWKQIDNALKMHVVGRWKGRPVQSITRREVIELLDAIVGTAPQMANRVHSALGSMFKWAIEQEIVTASPVGGLKAPAEKTERDRVLTDDELAEIWRACEGIGNQRSAIARLLILSAQRRAEVGGMAWSELGDLSERMWTIPRERAKNDRAHQVPLTDAMIAILSDVPRRKGGDLVFPTKFDGPFSHFDGIKSRIDAKVLAARQQAAEERGDDPRLVKPMPHWTFHDFRRTASTGMAKLGFRREVVDRILNHVSGAIEGVAAIYNRYEYLDERRSALDAWSRKVEALVNGSPDNVVPMTRKQTA